MSFESIKIDSETVQDLRKKIMDKHGRYYGFLGPTISRAVEDFFNREELKSTLEPLSADLAEYQGIVEKFLSLAEGAKSDLSKIGDLLDFTIQSQKRVNELGANIEKAQATLSKLVPKPEEE
jgi:hypothetical protein